MTIYPFFLECSKFEERVHRQRQLQQLAFGQAGLILSSTCGPFRYSPADQLNDTAGKHRWRVGSDEGGGGGNRQVPSSDPILLYDGGCFPVPEMFTEQDWLAFRAKMWHDDSSFSKLQEAIKETKTLWSNVKKAEKLRLIDDYIITLLASSSSDATTDDLKALRATISMALILKIIQPAHITYEDMAVKHINVTECRNKLLGGGDGGQ